MTKVSFSKGGGAPSGRKSYLWIVPFLLVLTVAALNVFVFLGRQPLTDYDESRHGVTAYEMLESGNYIATTYLNNLDYWNFKPPLGFWLITISYRIFGPSVFALRFFSAFLTCLTVLLTMLLAKRHFGRLVSLAAGCILATAYGFIWGRWLHAGRTGDFDAGLTFLAVLSLFFLDRAEENPVAFYLSAFTASLAFLLKSFGSAPLVLIVVLLLVTRRKIWASHPGRLAGFLFVYAVPIFTWAAVRYGVDGLFFPECMVKYDVLKRSSIAIEGNSGGPYFYPLTLWEGLMPWSLLLPVAALAVVAAALSYCRYRPSVGQGPGQPAEASEMRHVNFYLLWIAVPLVLFSIAKTKVTWYINPAYPPLAVLLGWGFIRLLVPSRPFGGPLRWGSVFLAAALFAYLFSGAEGVIVKQVREQSRAANPAQQALFDLPDGSYAKGSRLHLVGLSEQSIVFIAEAIKHLRLVSFSKYQFNALCTQYADNDIVNVELKTRKLLSSTAGNYLRTGRPGDLIMLANTPDNRAFLASNGLDVLSRNDSWIVAGGGAGSADGGIVSQGGSSCETVVGIPKNIEMPVRVNYGGEISLLGVGVEKIPGSMLRVNYYWRLTEGLGPYNTVFVHFTDEGNGILFQDDHLFCSGRSFGELKGKVVRETQLIDVPSTAGGKEVSVKIGMYDVISKYYDRLKIESAKGAAADDGNTRAIVGRLRM